MCSPDAVFRGLMDPAGGEVKARTIRPWRRRTSFVILGRSACAKTRGSSQRIAFGCWVFGSSPRMTIS